MYSRGLRPARRLVQSLLAHDTSTQLAAGFALGMVFGLLPKGNLIAVSLFVLLFSLRINTGMSLLAALAFSWIGPAFDPVCDKLGAYVLTSPALQATYASIFQLPLAPWFEFNNTAVVGSLILGLWAFYPVFWLSYQTIEWHRRRAPAAAAPRSGSTEPFQADTSLLNVPNERRAA